ncbi:hypothetical protein AB0I22_28610 [Streptomyces sp. NPDC050610]|uniref:hypothetical protein n=1 Tax=Streptomyces sp. NPDC050610 TaxID=3157097 RepID=UPI003416A58D
MERSLLSLRSALVLLLAVLTGIGAGVLTALAGDGVARSVLCGAAAVGVSVLFFDRLVAAEGHGTSESRGAAEGQGAAEDHWAAREHRAAGGPRSARGASSGGRRG